MLEGKFVLGDGRQEEGVESVGFNKGTQTAIAGDTGGNMQRKPPQQGFEYRTSARNVRVFQQREAGFDHRIGHFRPPENAVRILKCHISLGLEGLVLEKYRLGWPTL